MQRLALRELDHGVVKLAAHHKVNVLAGGEAFGRVDLNGRSHESDLQIGLGLFHHARQAKVARKPHGRSKQNHEVITACDPRRLFRRDLVRRRVQEATAGQHAGWVSQPDRVPIRLDLSRCRPARTGPPVKLLKAGRVEQKRLHEVGHIPPLWVQQATAFHDRSILVHKSHDSVHKISLARPWAATNETFSRTSVPPRLQH